MFNIKQLIKNILSYPIAYFILLKTRKLIIGSSNKRIFLFDIDNTIADSWHSLTLNIWANENERLKGLAIFLRMRKLVTILQKNIPCNFCYKFDVILIDETQDMMLDYYLLIKKFIQDTKRIWTHGNFFDTL